jgi:hypothetical protein
LSLFEPHSVVIRKGKLIKPNEFGRLVRIDEIENGIVSGYEVAAGNRADQQRAVREKKRWFRRGQAWRAGIESRMPRPNIALGSSALSTQEKPDSKDTWPFVCLRTTSWL